MFKDWKKAASLARFELGIATAHFLLVFFVAIFIALFLGITLEDYLKNTGTVFDLVFIGLFSIVPSLFKPSATQYQQVNGQLWASHVFIMHKQLPIRENILTKSRFIIHFAYSLPLLILVLTFTYPMITNVMTIGEYIIFSFIWLSFSIYSGLIMAVSDAGDYVNTKTMIIAILKLALMFGPLLLIFHFGFNTGIIAWTIMLAKGFPFLTIIMSIFFVIIGIHFWEYVMKRTIQKMDYF